MADEKRFLYLIVLLQHHQETSSSVIVELDEALPTHNVCKEKLEFIDF